MNPEPVNVYEGMIGPLRDLARMTFSVYLTAILIRHGQTEGNVSGIVQGQSDSPLTGEGISSTRKKAEKIKALSFDAVFCSDLPRATHSLKILKDALPLLPEPVLRPDLREIDFGDLTGLNRREIMPTVLKHKANPRLNYPNGESGAQFIARVKKFFLELLENHTGQTVLVVSHYGVLETTARQFAGTPPDEKVIIGRDDIWEMIFRRNLSAVKRVF